MYGYESMYLNPSYQVGYQEVFDHLQRRHRFSSLVSQGLYSFLPDDGFFLLGISENLGAWSLSKIDIEAAEVLVKVVVLLLQMSLSSFPSNSMSSDNTVNSYVFQSFYGDHLLIIHSLKLFPIILFGMTFQNCAGVICPDLPMRVIFRCLVLLRKEIITNAVFDYLCI